MSSVRMTRHDAIELRFWTKVRGHYLLAEVQARQEAAA